MNYAAVLLLGLVTVQRLAALVAGRRTATETPLGSLSAVVDAGWLGALWWLGREAPLDPSWLLAYVFLQIARGWLAARPPSGEVATSRGRTRRTRALDRVGPRWGDWVRAGEIAALPLVVGLPWIALGFSLVNAAVLASRIWIQSRARG